jgi:hypothetical protein
MTSSKWRTNSITYHVLSTDNKDPHQPETNLKPALGAVKARDRIPLSSSPRVHPLASFPDSQSRAVAKLPVDQHSNLNIK